MARLCRSEGRESKKLSELAGRAAQSAATPPAENDALGQILAAQEEVVFLWPENLPIWNHWLALQTQWRTGAAGATGLDYAAVLAYLAFAEPARAARREAFTCLQAMERAVLCVWNGRDDAGRRGQ